MSIDPTISNFVRQHALPSSYLVTAEKYFVPLAGKLARLAESLNRPLLVGVHGCQGSGKSTLTDFFVHFFKHEFNIQTIGMSIDDFYQTKAERKRLAETLHPLFATRGVPGTHDISLLKSVIDAFKAGEYPITIPRFDKSVDDRLPQNQSTVVNQKPSIILLEGWCVGSVPGSDETLQVPINKLEAEEDSDGSWRRYSNEQLAGDYQNLFSKLDHLVMLKAPGFHTVKNWRHEQEIRLKEKLVAQGADTSQLMDEASIERFIQHYERITSNSLVSLPEKADDVFELDENRMIHKYTERKGKVE